MSDTQTFERDFGFLFEAAAEGVNLQQRLDGSNDLAEAATSGAQEKFRDSGVLNLGSLAEVPDELAVAASVAVSLSVATEQLREKLSEKERLVAEQLAGMALSVRVLDGKGWKSIQNTYYSGGMVGTRRQEFGNFPRRHRNGTFRAALLGQNVLVLFPQWLSGQQMDTGNIIVPILREDGEPNIQIEQREPTWRDRLGRSAVSNYERAASRDISRLRQLATNL